MRRTIALAGASLASVAVLACGSTVFTGDDTSGGDGGNVDASSDSRATDGGDGSNDGQSATDPDGATSDASTKSISRSLRRWRKREILVNLPRSSRRMRFARPRRPGKLPGTFHSYLGLSPDYDGSSNIGGSGPWFLPDGITEVFPNRSAIQGNGALAAIDQNEKGEPIPIGRTAWTGASSGGGACSNWMDGTNVGVGEYGTTANALSWKTAGSLSCDTPSSLYCFQQ